MMLHLEQSQPTPACTDPEVGQLLAAYQFQLLDPCEQARFEAHTADCAACLQEVYQYGPYVAALREHPEWLDPPVPRSPWAAWRGWLPSIGPQKSWVLAMALVLVVTLAIPVYRSMTDPTRPLRQRAVLERPEVEVVIFRGGAPSWDKALALYQKEDYRRAAAALQAVVDAQPDQALAQLYLGYCYLRLGQTAQGLAALQQSVQAGEGALQEQARWLLANAYLKEGQVEKAQSELEAVVALARSHQKAAQKTLEAIHQLQGSRGAAGAPR